MHTIGVRQANTWVWHRFKLSYVRQGEEKLRFQYRLYQDHCSLARTPRLTMAHLGQPSLKSQPAAPQQGKPATSFPAWTPLGALRPVQEVSALQSYLAALPLPENSPITASQASERRGAGCR